LYINIFLYHDRRSIFRGLEATVWRHGLWNGAYFSVIHSFRSLMPTVSADGPLGSYGPRLRDFAAGTAAGIVATTVNIPTDVAKSRIQSSRGSHGWTLPTVAAIGRAEGLGALYKGFAPKVLRLGPGGGIMLVAFEAISGWILKLRGKDG
jgi:solute carrier family 25 2-oxodicarboxylate transporter 21